MYFYLSITTSHILIELAHLRYLRRTPSEYAVPPRPARTREFAVSQLQKPCKRRFLMEHDQERSVVWTASSHKAAKSWEMALTWCTHGVRHNYVNSGEYGSIARVRKKKKHDLIGHDITTVCRRAGLPAGQTLWGRPDPLWWTEEVCSKKLLISLRCAVWAYLSNRMITILKVTC